MNNARISSLVTVAYGGAFLVYALKGLEASVGPYLLAAMAGGALLVVLGTAGVTVPDRFGVDDGTNWLVLKCVGLALFVVGVLI